MNVWEVIGKMREREDARLTNKELKPLEAVVVFKGEDPKADRMFEFSSANKMFQSGMGGYSCYAVLVGGSARWDMWRIERMLDEEHVEEIWLKEEGNV